jgi:hypothetical protein
MVAPPPVAGHVVECPALRAAGERQDEVTKNGGRKYRPPRD